MASCTHGYLVGRASCFITSPAGCKGSLEWKRSSYRTKSPFLKMLHATWPLRFFLLFSIHLISHQNFLCPSCTSKFELLLIPQCVFTVLCPCARLSLKDAHLIGGQEGSRCASRMLSGCCQIAIHSPSLDDSFLTPRTLLLLGTHCCDHCLILLPHSEIPARKDWLCLPRVLYGAWHMQMLNKCWLKNVLYFTLPPFLWVCSI